MKLNFAKCLMLTYVLGIAQYASAQYPDIPSDVKRWSDSLMEAARVQSDIAWEQAKPVIEKEAKDGKPFIPWASRPTDLPQADIPAFPGAEGGGKYSFGGRGGKVYVVTNLNDALWANNAGRNPSIGWNGIFNFANNVVFNWVHRSIDGGDYRANYNIINNYFKPGPATPKNTSVGHRILKPESGRSKLKYLVFGRAYVNGNIMEGYDHITKENWNGGVQVEDEANAGKYKDMMKWNKPHPMPAITILPTQKAFQYVMSNVGATLPKRDAVDARVVEQVKTGKINYKEGVKLPETQFKHRRLPIDSYKIGIITDVSQVGGYPEYKGTPYKDADNDGMPDAWEKKVGLNPNSAADASLDRNKDGYTNIEEYLNSVVDLKTVKPAAGAKSSI